MPWRFLDHPHKVSGIHQAVHRTGIQPGKAAQQLDIQLVFS